MSGGLALIAGSILLLFLSRRAAGFGPSEPVPPGGLAAVWRWRQLAVQAGMLYGVDPAVILGIIDKESDGDPAAPGEDGEFGLGQFKPIAAHDIGDRAVARTPAGQIDQIARLFRLQMRRTGGDRFQALRAYNQGFQGKDADARRAALADAYARDTTRLINVYAR